ncbi:MAG: cation:proton antiporter [Candidatus Altiarchaeota archaeon]|nr:cation:proton antiporter [Candidatus Altiarchaeota archaeon]
MESFFLFISGIFLFTFVAGALIERLRIPWIFSALILGALLSVDNMFGDLTGSDMFVFLAKLGMYFLLFIIGFEIDLGEMRKKEGFILKTTFHILALEALVGGVFVKYVLGVESYVISFIVALSFATVGEAILVPILDEFRMARTRLGQTLIDVGTLDDLIEIMLFVFVVLLIGSSSPTYMDVGAIVFSLLILFLITALLTGLRKESEQFSFRNIETLFLFVLFLLFLFTGIGEYAQAAPFAAILAGVSLRTFIPQRRLGLIESEARTMCYGFFAPIFFVWVGASIDLTYLFKYPLLIVLIILLSNGLKVLGSYFSARKELGAKQSVLLGIGLSARFSTGIIIVKILLDNGLIDAGLYSLIVAASALFTFIVPLLFSMLLVRWGVTGRRHLN